MAMGEQNLRDVAARSAIMEVFDGMGAFAATSDLRQIQEFIINIDLEMTQLFVSNCRNVVNELWSNVCDAFNAHTHITHIHTLIEDAERGRTLFRGMKRVRLWCIIDRFF